LMLKFATTDSDNRFTTFTATSPRGEVDCETLMYPKKFEEARRAVQKGIHQPDKTPQGDII